MLSLLILAALDPASLAIARSLPPELTLVSAHVPARLAEATDVVVAWRTPPRAGATRVELITPTRRAFVAVVLAELDERPTAARALPAGHVLSEDDVLYERRPGDTAPLPEGVLVGATTTRALAAGEELSTTTLALPPPLARGTPLTVIVRVAGLVATRAGRLEAPARIGERARVRLDGVSRLAHVRLLSNDTAALETADMTERLARTEDQR